MTANAETPYTVTFLEMAEPPRGAPAPPPAGGPYALMRAASPPVHYFLYLYQTVGAAYRWEDMLALPEAELVAEVTDPKLELYTLLCAGAPGGFFQLDFRAARRCDLAYFGLMPELIGRGVGPWLLDAAVREAWGRGIDVMSVNTCTLDHPKALATYQRAGFSPVRREDRVRAATS